MFVLHILLQRFNIFLKTMLSWGIQTGASTRAELAFMGFFIANQTYPMNKPKLNISEAFHRLVSNEGQKELARRLKAVQKMQKWR